MFQLLPAGNGRACFAATGTRAKMSTYLQALKTTTGYESLKTKYMRQLSRNHPNLQGEPDQLNTTQAGDMDRALDDEDEESEVSLAVLPINPIVEKDKEIAELTKNLEDLKQQLEALPAMQKGLDDAKAENKRVQSVSRQVVRRLSVSRKANEQKMVSLIMTGNNWTEDSAHLACSQAATLNEDDFELDEENDLVKPKKNNFMKKVEDSIEADDKIQKERLEELKRLILEQMKKTIKNKSDTRGEKRGPEGNDPGTALSKPRITSPPKI